MPTPDLLFSLCFLLAVICGCSNDPGDKRPLPIHAKYAATLLQDDFDQVLRVLKKNHPALYDFTSQKEFDSLVSAQRNKINDSLTITGFYELLAPIVYSIGCGHTTLNLPGWVWNDSTIALQREVFFFKDRAWLKPGLEVLSINNMAIDDLLQHVKNYASTDGNNLSASRYHMNQNFNLYAATYLGFPGDYKVEIKKTDGSIDQVPLSTVSIREYEDLRNESSPLLDLEIDSLESTAVITIKSFDFYNDVQRFKSFVDNSFKEIEKNKCMNLILDLRGNSGGDPFCASHLFAYLVNKPTAYFSKSYGRYEHLALRLKPATQHFKGKLYTLIDGGCFSTTGHLSALLRYNGIGEFIGTETGGTYTCNDGSQTYRLINTGILIRVPGATFEAAVDGVERFKGITPDHIVERSFEDFANGKDVVMQFAKSRCRMQL